MCSKFEGAGSAPVYTELNKGTGQIRVAFR